MHARWKSLVWMVAIFPSTAPDASTPSPSPIILDGLRSRAVLIHCADLRTPLTWITRCAAILPPSPLLQVLCGPGSMRGRLQLTQFGVDCGADYCCPYPPRPTCVVVPQAKGGWRAGVPVLLFHQAAARERSVNVDGSVSQVAPLMVAITKAITQSQPYCKHNHIYIDKHNYTTEAIGTATCSYKHNYNRCYNHHHSRSYKHSHKHELTHSHPTTATP